MQYAVCMAAIDSLLRLIETRMAEGLVVQSDEAPWLEKGGEQVALTMPPIPASLVEGFVDEVVGDAQKAELEEDTKLEGSYTADDGAEFRFEVSREGGGYRLAFHAVETELVEVIEPEPELQTDASVPKKIDPEVQAVLARGLADGASDIFFSSGKPPRFRVDGRVEPASGQVVTETQVLSLSQLGESGDRARVFARDRQLDCGLKIELGGRATRFRVSLFRHHEGVAASLRPIRDGVPSFEELNLPPDLRKLGEYPNGLVLVTGAAGMGKSTTLAAVVDHINANKARHIITLEDPIEFAHRSEKSLVHQRELGADVPSFNAGLRAALRESPDVILLGEMRDRDTVEAALTAAETGHLVLSTLHTRDASSAIDRIIDTFPGNQQGQARLQLSASLREVVTQMLLPAMGGKGRVPAIERLFITSAVAHLIRDGKEHQVPSQIQSGKADGMVTMERSLAKLVRARRISETVAEENAPDIQILRNLLAGRA